MRNSPDHFYKLPSPAWYFVLITEKKTTAVEHNPWQSYHQRKQIDDDSKTPQLYILAGQPPLYFYRTKATEGTHAGWEHPSSDQLRQLEPLESTLGLMTNEHPLKLASSRKLALLLECPNWKTLAEEASAYLKWKHKSMEAFPIDSQRWLLKIVDPPYGITEQRRAVCQKRKVHLFWSWPESKTLFYADGLYPALKTSPLPVLPSDGIFLLSENEVRYFKASSPRPIQEFVKVLSPKSVKPISRTTQKILIPLELIKTPNHQSPHLLRGTDPSLLKAATRSYPWDDFSSIRYAPLEDGSYVLMSEEKSALWAELSEYMSAYRVAASHIYIPVGTRLVPDLDTEHLQSLFTEWHVGVNVVMILDGIGPQVQATIINSAMKESLTHAISLLFSQDVKASNEGQNLKKLVSQFVSKNPAVTLVKEPVPPSSNSKQQAVISDPESIRPTPGRKKAARKKTPAKIINDRHLYFEEQVDDGRLFSPPSSLEDEIPQIFMDAAFISPEEIHASLERTLTHIQITTEALPEWQMCSSYFLATGDVNRSTGAWSQSFLESHFPEDWHGFWNHPSLSEIQEIPIFLDRLRMIEDKNFPAETHWTCVSLTCLEFEEPEHFAVIQEEMSNEFFLGLEHPFCNFSSSTPSTQVTQQPWTPQQEYFWANVTTALPETLRPLAAFHAELLRHFASGTNEPVWHTRPDKNKTQGFGNGLARWRELLQTAVHSSSITNLWARILSYFSSDIRTANFQYTIFPPPHADVIDALVLQDEQIYQRYKSFLQIHRNSDLLPIADQHIFYKQIVLDMIKNATIFRWMWLFFTPVEVVVSPHSVLHSLNLLNLQLELSRDYTKRSQLLQTWIPKLVPNLPPPREQASLDPWLRLIQLSDQSSEEERLLIVNAILMASSVWEPENEGENAAMTVLLLCYGVLFAHQASDEKRSSTFEWTRKTRWSQFARELSRRSFEELAHLWKETK